MKRRDFLKSSLLAVAFSTVVGKTTGLFNNALAAVVMVAPGKLGYKEAADKSHIDAKKQCKTCHYFKADAGAATGACTLPAMKSAMKAAEAPHVQAEGFCNMWKKKA